MERGFFNETDLLKKKKNDGREAELKRLQMLKKQNAPKISQPSRMDEERYVPSQTIHSGSMRQNEEYSNTNDRHMTASTLIQRLVRRFLVRRRMCRESLKGLQNRVSQFRILLQRMPTLQNRVFLERNQLTSLVRDARLTYIAGIKDYKDYVSPKRPVLTRLVNEAIAELTHLLSLINLSYDHEKTGVSLFKLLIVNFATDIQVHLLFHALTELLLQLNGCVNEVTHLDFKVEFARYLATLLDPKFAWQQQSSWPTDSDSLQYQQMFFETFFIRNQLTKALHSSLVQIERQTSLNAKKSIRDLQVACFCEHALAKKLLEVERLHRSPTEITEPYMTQARLENLVLPSFESALGGPGLVEPFYNTIFRDQTLGPVILSYIGKLGGSPFVNEQTLNRDSKKFLLFSFLYMFTKIIQLSDIEEQ